MGSFSSKEYEELNFTRKCRRCQRFRKINRFGYCTNYCMKADIAKFLQSYENSSASVS